MKTFKKGMMIKAKTTVKKVSPSAKGLTAGKPSKQTAGKQHLRTAENRHLRPVLTSSAAERGN